MKRLSVFLYSQILGKKIYDEFNDILGELKDIYVSTDEGYPRAIGYNVKKMVLHFIMNLEALEYMMIMEKY